MKHLVSFFLGVAAVAAAPSPATAQIERLNFGIRGVVRTNCTIRVDQPSPSTNANVVELGRIEQVCNSGSGYRVIIAHAAGLSGAQIMIDGAVVPLGAGNETIILDSSGPDERTSNARLTLASGSPSIGSLAFRIEPKGVIY
jgi:hypothetical protein